MIMILRHKLFLCLLYTFYGVFGNVVTWNYDSVNETTQVFERVVHMLEDWKLAQEMRKIADLLASNISQATYLFFNLQLTITPFDLQNSEHSLKNVLFFYRQGLKRLKSCHNDQNHDRMSSFNSKLKFNAPENRTI